MTLRTSRFSRSTGSQMSAARAGWCTTRTEQRAWCATRSLTLPSARRPCRPREPTTTRSARRERSTSAATGCAASQLSTLSVQASCLGWSIRRRSRRRPRRLHRAGPRARPPSRARRARRRSRRVRRRRSRLPRSVPPCGRAISTEQVPSCSSSVAVSPSTIPRKRLLCRPPSASSVASASSRARPQDRQGPPSHDSRGGVGSVGQDRRRSVPRCRCFLGEHRPPSERRRSRRAPPGSCIERSDGVRRREPSAGASTSVWRSASNPHSVPSTPTTTRANTATEALYPRDFGSDHSRARRGCRDEPAHATLGAGDASVTPDIDATVHAARRPRARRGAARQTRSRLLCGRTCGGV